MKIKTPFQFTIFTSISCAVVINVCVFLIFEKLYGYDIMLSLYLLVFLVVAVFMGVLIYFLVESFINQKIRLLYRMVQSYKMTKSDQYIDMREDILSLTEVDILKWVKTNRAELSKLKEEEKFRREFIGNLAHELKTPIFSIQGYILTLLEGGLDDDNVNRKFLNRTLKGVERMNRIISSK